jgi:hypothetical protein
LASSSFKQARAAPKAAAKEVSTTVKSPICEMLGIEFPLVEFSHCRDVVAAISPAAGCGVLGAPPN